jgi:hypothetical protein
VKKKSKELIHYIRIIGCCLFFVVHLQVLAEEDDKSYAIVSDIDDTIRISNVLSKYDVIRRGLVGSDVFQGMKELYEELGKASKGITYLSGSPHWFANQISTFLINRMGFPLGDIILSNWWYWESTENFKTREIVEISEKKKFPFVIVGDDTQADPKVFSTFKKVYGSDRTLAIYIHRIQDIPLPDEVTPFWNAYDIALHEFENGRLKEHQVLRVGEVILNTPRLDLVFPTFKICPNEYTSFPGKNAQEYDSLRQMSMKIQDRIQRYCVIQNAVFLSLQHYR